MLPSLIMEDERDGFRKRKKREPMKTFVSALVGLPLMIGTVMAAQAPAASPTTPNSGTTNTTKKVKKTKKHAKPAAGSTTAAPTASTPSK